jgi:hypothetical protein
MGKIYQAFQKSQGLAALDADSSTSRTLDTEPGVPEIPASAAGDTTQAVTDLLHNKSLSHRFGVQWEWEVRTTLTANRRAWHYRSRVLIHGKELSKVFPAIDGNRARQPGLSEAAGQDVFAAFAREAVAVHFARCTSIAEHCRIAPIPSRPRRWHARIKTIALVLCGVVALATAYWLWKGSDSLKPEQAHSNQPERIAPPPRLRQHWTW